MSLRLAPATVPHRWLQRLRTGVTLIALTLPACTGVIGDLPGENVHGSSGSGGPGGPGSGAEQGLAARSRFPRLTHVQWENTMRDLLHLEAAPGLSASFTGDPLGGVFDNNETVLQVTPGLWSDYQQAAEELAALVTSDPAKLAKILPTDTMSDPDTRARAFIEDFGRRAYRRPLTGAEVDGYVALFAKGKDILASADPFKDGIQFVLQGFLQSPHLVYRVEQSDKPRADGLIPLNGFELATRLSYLLWNTMPDEDLLLAAESGELATSAGVRAYAEKMLADPRARDTIASFHYQLYDYEKYLDLNKDKGLFPQYVPEMGEDMQREAQLFVDDIVFEKEGGLTQLLTSRSAFVNDRLASVYGVEGDFSGEFSPVELDAEKRSGLLTRLGFLASQATANQPDTIHRGVFVNLRVLCAALPPPPDNATGIPVSNEKTNRDRVDAHTGKGTCGESCHGTLINPIGFAFENYDAIGQFRTMDNGYPVNAAAEYMLGGQAKKFENAVELSQVLAESKEAHRCYAQHWLEFAYGRASTKADNQTLDKLAEESLTGLSVKSLFLSLVESDAFTARAPVEAQ